MEHNGTTKTEGKKTLQAMCMHSLSTKRGCKVRKKAQTLYQVSDAQQNQQDRGREYMLLHGICMSLHETCMRLHDHVIVCIGLLLYVNVVVCVWCM